MSSEVKGNLLGIIALLLWSTLVGLIKNVSVSFGVEAGTALIYSIATIFSFIVGAPKLKDIPIKYFFMAGTAFILTEIFFSQAIAMAKTPSQVLEAGMLNYLWPSLTILFSMIINNVKLRWIIWLGIFVTIFGMYLCIGASGGLSINSIIANINNNPIAYIFATLGAISWALYSNLSVKYSKGVNGVSYFFAIVAIILWIRFFISGANIVMTSYFSLFSLIILGAILGLSYLIWEKAIHKGNFIFLVICSYFIPAVSMIFASILLKSFPNFEYWIGVIFVIIGSLLSWLSKSYNIDK